MPLKGFKHSVESREKMSISRKGKFAGKESPHWGKHLSVEHREKLSLAGKGDKNPFYGRHHTEETKRKIGEKNHLRVRTEEEIARLKTIWTGHKHSEVTRKYMSENSPKRGKPMPEEIKQKLRNRKRSEATCKRLSEIRKKYHQEHPLSLEERKRRGELIKGEKNYNWKGGTTAKQRERFSTFEWNNLRREIYRRDNWHCTKCHKQCYGMDIQAHHMIPVRRDPSKEFNSDFIVTLCKSCHTFVEHKLVPQAA